jgi:hypothetical protein
MSIGVSVEQKSKELLKKWSKEQQDVIAQRQHMFKEATDSFLGVVNDSLKMRVPEESLKRLCGNILELYSLPTNMLVDNKKLEEYSRECQKVVAAMQGTLSGNGFSEEFKKYGKATWTNGSRASSAYMNWMKDLLREQKITADGKEAGQVVKSCLELTESFIEESVACWMDQVKASSGLVRTTLPKEGTPAQPVQ